MHGRKNFDIAEVPRCLARDFCHFWFLIFYFAIVGHGYKPSPSMLYVLCVLQ
jgi:hypothetical protein